MSYLAPGQTVKLKALAAKNYGFDPSIEYKVVEMFQKNGYKILWVRLEGGTLEFPFNVVKASELR
jgi:hypothetical protein